MVLRYLLFSRSNQTFPASGWVAGSNGYKSNSASIELEIEIDWCLTIDTSLRPYMVLSLQIGGRKLLCQEIIIQFLEAHSPNTQVCLSACPPVPVRGRSFLTSAFFWPFWTPSPLSACVSFLRTPPQSTMKFSC